MMKIVGEIRPSQLMFSFGVGAIIDLPAFSALVMGLDFWRKDHCVPVNEPRLLQALRRIVGSAVHELRLPPVQGDDEQTLDQGIPVVPFPRWMRCTWCGLMAPLEDGLFEKREDRYHHKPLHFVHTLCPRGNQKFAPPVLPVRFLFVCSAGHISDVPWVEFVHDGHPCVNPLLYMNQYGVTGDISSITITCKGCKDSRKGKEVKKNLLDLLNLLRGDNPHFHCNGLYPHLRSSSKNICDERPHLINLGASNIWFPQTVSVLSIPDSESELVEYIRDHWDDLEDANNIDAIKYLQHPRRLDKLRKFSPESILQAIQNEKNPPQEEATSDDIKLPEWNVFVGKTRINKTKKLEIHHVSPPSDFENIFESGMQVHRLSVVRAMYGFTRLDTQQELDLGIVTKQHVAPVTNLSSPEWLPAYESHGEGIFIRMKEDVLQEWENRPSVQRYAEFFMQAHRAWRKSRRFENLDEGFPGMRFILLHSLSHALMQQIVLDCGYTAASISERLYCRTPDAYNGPMAGLLIYTAAADSEGTLGGLVSLGKPEMLGRYILQALENIKLCSSDPLCSERLPEADGHGIHAAACHACLFAPETSCECGNRYLDRNVLVPTFSNRNMNISFWE